MCCHSDNAENATHMIILWFWRTDNGFDSVLYHTGCKLKVNIQLQLKEERDRDKSESHTHQFIGWWDKGKIKLLFSQRSSRSSHSCGCDCDSECLSLHQSDPHHWTGYQAPPTSGEYQNKVWQHLMISSCHQVGPCQKQNTKKVYTHCCYISTTMIPHKSWGFVDTLSISSGMMVDSTMCKHVHT